MPLTLADYILILPTQWEQLSLGFVYSSCIAVPLYILFRRKPLFGLLLFLFYGVLFALLTILEIQVKDPTILFWHVYDNPNIRELVRHTEPIEAWKLRLGSWIGGLAAFSIGLLLDHNPWLKRHLAAKRGTCLCGYPFEGLTTNTCPECGRTLKDSCSSSPPSA